MKYNIIPFKNIDSEVFLGKFNGEEYPIQPEDVRYFPSNLSKHLAKQLAGKLFVKASKESEKKINIADFQKEIEIRVLGKEIMTQTTEKPKTFKQEALEIEAEYKKILYEEGIKEKSKEIEAIKIIENQPIIQ